MGGSNSCALKATHLNPNVQRKPRHSLEEQLSDTSTDSIKSFQKPTQNGIKKGVERAKGNSPTVFRVFNSPRDSFLEKKFSEEVIEIYGPNSLMDQYISGSNVFNEMLGMEQSYPSINSKNIFNDTPEINEVKQYQINKEKSPISCPEPCNCCGRFHDISHTNSPSNNQKRTSQQPDTPKIQFCCICQSMHEIQDDSSECSERSKQIEYVDLPYQKTDLYQQLMRELEETIHKRNTQRQERERLFKQNQACSCSRCEKYRRNYGCFCRNKYCSSPTNRYRNNHQNTMYYP